MGMKINYKHSSKNMCIFERGNNPTQVAKMFDGVLHTSKLCFLPPVVQDLGWQHCLTFGEEIRRNYWM